MATCSDCHLEMLTADGCTVGFVTIDGVPRSRLKETLCGEFEDGDRCHDCGAKPGNFHHFHCDNEPCPQCGGQLFVCSCDKE